MSNPSKEKGTRQETAICKYLNGCAGREVARRVPLHGSEDHGDIHITMLGLLIVGESKCSSSYPSEGKLDKYKSQTVEENENAHGDGGLLFVNLPRRGMDRMEVWAQRSTLFRLDMRKAGVNVEDIPQFVREVLEQAMRDSETSWRRMTMHDFACEYIKERE